LRRSRFRTDPPARTSSASNRRYRDPKTNGCPRHDQDKDGILNDADACPIQEGPKSEDPKDQRLPASLHQERTIQILGASRSSTSQGEDQAGESDSLLTEVAKVMNRSPEIKRVRVEGHNDNKGGAVQREAFASSVRLGDSEAQQPRTSQPIGGSTKKAMGLKQSLVPTTTEATRALNRRVEFHSEDRETARRWSRSQRANAGFAPPKSVDQPPRPKATKP